MRQPELPDIGDKLDVAKHRLGVAKEDTVEQIQTAKQLIELVEEYCK